ncbi:50S ribosomal protein L4 sunset domain variant [Microlunatus sp. Y2014]|uniref:50S ribosomal protein L4, sunset domain variant n=1 Tax=Microlunatus sp. Y2014 TaxID=3418488 RepID=UPI003DA7993C
MSTSRTVDVIDAKGAKAGTAELPAELFDVQANVPLIHQVVVAQLAAARQGTHATKTRGDVRGGGAKPWRQKGTGRARQGSRRAPQWTGGGVVHGPQPRSYAQRTPKKMVVAALRGALSDRARGGRVHVVDNLVDNPTPSAKQAVTALAKLVGADTLDRRVLVVLHRDEDLVWLSLRNVPAVHAIAADQLNAYDVLCNDDIVFTSAALTAFVAGPASGRAAKATATESEAAEPSNAELAAAAAPLVEDTSEPSTDELSDQVDYGANSYRGDEPPAGFDVKGNEDSMKFHTPESPWYGRTQAEVWFNSTEAAEAAGFVNAVKSDDSEGDDDK